MFPANIDRVFLTGLERMTLAIKGLPGRGILGASVPEVDESSSGPTVVSDAHEPLCYCDLMARALECLDEFRGWWLA